ncbi:flagellar basal-body rod protein FlgF [Aestuariispira ectoiniformans]|uniref:flagellar basal-body rod protein FlgF n=1 Tax=Aestuariispira ectoiniformans TaxID=2775080 RepID=UPI00223C5031|nr:flagellar basal-body rod protein FlgF [Aestuariispira ectoiniformans]
MENSSYIALSRQMTLANEMSIVANNIANANTPAYKGEKMVFQEFIDKPTRGEKLSFVQDVGLARDLSEGPMKVTNNPLDVAIKDKGYFVVDTPMGQRFTRHGRFQIDANSQLVTSAGYTVRGLAGPIIIPQDQGQVTIAEDGTVSTQEGIVGTLQLVDFADEQQLRKGADGLYSSDTPPQNVATPSVAQGMLEESNVKPIIELTRMIQVHRDYQSVQNFIKAEDDRLKNAINRLGRASA